MANISESENIKKNLIVAIQEIEKTVGLEPDSEGTIVNMALVYLFNIFDIGLALDSSEVHEHRNKLLSDLKTVVEVIEEK